MISLEDYIVQNFSVGAVRFNAESHVTPDGIVKFRIITNKLGHHDEFECHVKNNLVQVIENNYAKD
jgi:hypothetical protein